MKNIFIILLVGLGLSVSACSPASDTDSADNAASETAAVADTSYAAALKATAQIVKAINHQPSAAQKSALVEYIDAMDSSVNGEALAQTMGIVKRIEHFPSDADKAKLETLIASLRENDGDPHLIALMEVVANVAHKVSGADAAKLDKIIAEL